MVSTAILQDTRGQPQKRVKRSTKQLQSRLLPRSARWKNPLRTRFVNLGPTFVSRRILFTWNYVAYGITTLAYNYASIPVLIN